MSRLAPIVLTAAALAASPAASQSWSRLEAYGSYGDGRRDWTEDRSRYGDGNSVPSSFDWRSQLDRPGDYRCDGFRDANRTDCGARWRDRRHRVSPQARRDYRDLAGYRHDGSGWSGHGYGHDHYGYGYSHDRYSPRRRGYGPAYGYDHGAGGTSYHGAYGRPDVVFPGARNSFGGRDPGRISWCRGTYRSYDPGSGYYRAWSGRLIWCG